eukprot:6274428-Lingulodinium_polyedra.AAC.1
MIPGGIAGEEVSYCAGLCQKFADIAVTKPAGAYAGGESAQLRAQLETTRVKWQTAMHQQSERKDAKEVLADFRLQLAGCQDQIKVEFEK